MTPSANCLRGKASQRRLHLVINTVSFDATPTVSNQDFGISRNFSSNFGDLTFAKQNLD
ncbi:hypothetical protein [Nostoc sp. JL33]|uniref:hypothetical protein n=1 Tax=Nostoc sp. JL33 TaxID=2815396 RepID=UPI0025FF4BB8|nr:hypothetical protein [Nostoc sp. JL33]MBN3870951.1 hypothetical protein [Nostoc sp. JL33]